MRDAEGSLLHYVVTERFGGCGETASVGDHGIAHSFHDGCANSGPMAAAAIQVNRLVFIFDQ